MADPSFGGGAVVDFAQQLLDVAKRCQARVESGAVTGAKQLQGVAQALGCEADGVQFGGWRVVGEQVAYTRIIGRHQARQLTARIRRGGGARIPSCNVALAHGHSSSRLRHLREVSWLFQRRIWSDRSRAARRRSASRRVMTAARREMPACPSNSMAISRSRTAAVASIKAESSRRIFFQ